MFELLLLWLLAELWEWVLELEPLLLLTWELLLLWLLVEPWEWVLELEPLL